MSKSDLAVRVRGLSKSYTIAHQGEKHVTLAEQLLAKARRPFARTPKETFWALKDVEFDIKKGDVVGIIGRNGAGKSTLLKILSRITEPTTGQIDLYGRVGSLLEVGTGFHPELTGRENVFLNGAILGMTKAEIRKQFDAIVDFAGVEKFLDTPVKRYSSGMYVRLAFAVAAHLNPEILIVDEVLAVGDATFQKKCIGKMQDVANGGRTVLFVSHNVGVLKELCASAVFLEAGQVKMIGPINSVVGAYVAEQINVSTQRMSVRGCKRHADLGQILKVIEVVLNRSRPIYYGGPFEVTVVVESVSPVSQVAIGVGIGTAEGVRLITMESDQPGPRWTFERGVASVTFALAELWLEPGMYSLSVGARSGAVSILDYIPHCGYLEVSVGDCTTAAAQAGWGGGMRPPTVWRKSHVGSALEEDFGSPNGGCLNPASVGRN